MVIYGRSGNDVCPSIAITKQKERKNGGWECRRQGENHAKTEKGTDRGGKRRFSEIAAGRAAKRRI